MSLFNVFEISQSALSAQSVRLNTIASNLANADVVSGTADSVYRAKHPIFSAVFNSAMADQGAAGVRVDSIVESQALPYKEYAPTHPLAGEDGFIYKPNVNSVEEMANMMSASRSYQSSIEAMNTTKQLIIRTLSLGS